MAKKLIPILIFIVSLEIFFWLNGFTSTAFWNQVGRFGLSPEATFLLFFGTLSEIFLLITIITAGYMMYGRVLKERAFLMLTIIAFYLGGFGFWLAGFIPVFEARTGFVSVWCSASNTPICFGMPSEIFAPYVYATMVVGIFMIFVLLKKEKII